MWRFRIFQYYLNHRIPTLYSNGYLTNIFLVPPVGLEPTKPEGKGFTDPPNSPSLARRQIVLAVPPGHDPGLPT